jgi:hypothetical protein
MVAISKSRSDDPTVSTPELAAEWAPKRYGGTLSTEGRSVVMGASETGGIESSSSRPVGIGFAASTTSPEAGFGRLLELPRREASPSVMAEYQQLLAQHRSMASRKVLEGLDPSEARQLGLLRWRLDQLREVVHPRSRGLADLVATQEALASEVRAFTQKVESLRLSHRPARRR